MSLMKMRKTMRTIKSAGKRRTHAHEESQLQRDCSNGECVSLEKAFTEENFDSVETLIKKKLSRLTEFEQCMLDYAKARDEYEFDSTKVVELNDKVIELTKSYAKELLDLAKKEMPLPEDTVIFQKGVEEGKRLMMEDAVEGDIVKTINDKLALHSRYVNLDKFHFGDKFSK